MRLLGEAARQIRDDGNAIPVVGAALAALRIEAGELPEDELEGYPFPGEPRTGICTCPPGLVKRGGYTGSCRADHKPQEGEG